ncbi:MAG TPA: DUF1957 domain-containing protein [bacterium]|nr:DUF1957 domain-containing protein [bacterium]HOL47321.1 DUF1957 domain-containing protein [bacterium]HPQ17975.1 DUF1957 domain-containing protein [bacterium]
MLKGYIALMLHAHLPFVRHPEYEDFLEEDWLYEAITETYIPLYTVFERLLNDNINFKITMSITPPLANMLSDNLLQQRYIRHLNNLIELIEKEEKRIGSNSPLTEAVQMYKYKFIKAREIFCDQYKNNILTGFKKIQDAGALEIVTCCATHGFLPLMIHKEAMYAQIKVAVDDYKRYFNKQPNGIWLAECGYKPGVERFLKANDIRFFFIDTHGILLGTPQPKYGVFAPVYCPNGVAAFGRDVESSKQVWSADEGYPGDFDYREFYRDVGYDLDYDYIKPFLHKDGIRRNIGIKYYRITGKVALHNKQPYIPKNAIEKVAIHAGNFLFNRTKQVEYLYDVIGKPPIIVSPYDAELYGHWWYEGPDFLNFFLRKTACDQDILRLTTPYEFLQLYPKHQVVQPVMSTWGDKGYNEVWLNPGNDWIYRHLHKGAEIMINLANKFPDASGILERALNQCARELLLAQSSDWAFIITTNTMVAYAEKRTRDHIHNLLTLKDQILNNSIKEDYLKNLEWRNNIFPNIDYRVYKTDNSKNI